MAETYDFVIVGGGTAGLVLANRLSEDADTSVLVLEAGSDKDQDPRVIVPGLWRANAGTEQDWAFTTTPQEHLNGRVVNHSQGKMLGGTSSLNALVITPPSASDLNAWEKIGNTGWGWNAVKPYSTGFFSLDQPKDDTHKRLDLGWSKDSWLNVDKAGLGGPVKLSFAEVQEEGPVASAWIEAISNLGYPLTDNPFEGNSSGPFNGASTIDQSTKTRVSSSTAYYQPAKERKNLRVLTESSVQKILLEKLDEEHKATGVEYIRGEEKVVVKAAKDVILCAGALQSPKLLELSGIGDPKILSQYGIETKVANPFVGTNLQDHLMHALSFESTGSFPTRDDLLRRDAAAIQTAMGAYKTNQSGPFCSSAVTSFAYIPVDDFKNDRQLRDTFLSNLAESEVKHPLDPHRIEVLRNLIQNETDGTGQFFPYVAQSSLVGGALQPGNFITFVVALSHPLSTGTVHIASPDITVPPTINHEYLSNPLDIELQARQVRYIEKIVATEPIASLLKKDGRRNHEAAFINGDLDRAKQYLKIAGTTNYHSVGTCAMAPREKGGVVDPELRVYGVGGLRVVDASVMPLVPQSNTQSVVYAIAEKATDIIRGKI